MQSGECSVVQSGECSVVHSGECSVVQSAECSGNIPSPGVIPGEREGGTAGGLYPLIYCTVLFVYV